MRVKHAQDFWSGIMFLAFGLLGIWLSQDYSMGTAAKMGPGYFPTALSILLIVIGLVIAVTAMLSKQTGGDFPTINYKIIAWICGSIVLFGVLLTYMGLFLACLGVIFFSSMASDEHSYKVATISGLLLATASVAMFVWGLKLQFAVWPPFLMR